MHCLLLLRVSLLLLPSFNTSAIVTSATFVAAAFIDTSFTKFQQTFFSTLPSLYKGKSTGYFLVTLHKVPGAMAVPRTATAYLSSAFSSSLTHCKHTPTAGVHIF